MEAGGEADPLLEAILEAAREDAGRGHGWTEPRHPGDSRRVGGRPAGPCCRAAPPTPPAPSIMALLGGRSLTSHFNESQWSTMAWF